jgi:trimethylamine---corrinoid protein Co-methyltransferase
MRVNMQFQQVVGLNTISYDQFEEIHLATLEILDRVGVRVSDTEALDLLKKAGARVDGNLAKIPASLVQDALASAPCRVPISNRSGERAMRLEKGRSYYGSGSDTPNTIDIETGARRLATKQDVINATIISDSLENIDFIMSLALASDVPTADSYIHQFEAMVLNTSKPIVYTADNLRDLEIIVKMAEVVAGGAEALAANPFIILYDEPSSPLQHSEEAVQKLLFLAEKRLPVIYIPALMMGATGPVTAAGAIVVANCESLSGLVIHQLKAKGAPFIYGGGIPPLDMKTSVCSYAAPEEHLNCAVMVKMAQYYNLPVFTTSGCSDSQLFDQQAGMEAGFNLLASTLAGGNLIHDLGYIGSGMTSSIEMLILCNETVSMAKHFLKGITITPETLALDVIEKVGPGGNYFAEEHTFNNFKKHLWVPELLNRHSFDHWNSSGATTYAQRANEKARAILENHKPVKLPAEVANKVSELGNSSK